MRLVGTASLGLVLFLCGSCSLLLDTDKLRQGTGQPSGPDASSDVSSVETGTTDVSLGELGSALAGAICGNLTACLGPGLEVLIRDEDCVPFYTASLEDGLIGAVRRSVEEQKVLTYDAGKAGQCLQQFTGPTAEEVPKCADVRTSMEACKAMFSGRLPSASACSHLMECDVGLFCDTTASCPGSCAPYRDIGAPCQNDGQCKLGSGCSKPKNADAGTLGACAAYVPEKSPCTDESICTPGTMCLSNKCLPALNVFIGKKDGPCYKNEILCEKGLSCEFTGTPLAGPGECVGYRDPNAECRVGIPDSCGPNAYCTAGVKAGTCVPLPGEGSPCATDFEQKFQIDISCSKGLVCVKDRCVARKRLADSCEANEQCYSGQCGNTSTGFQCQVPNCL